MRTTQKGHDDGYSEEGDDEEGEGDVDELLQEDDDEGNGDDVDDVGGYLDDDYEEEIIDIDDFWESRAGVVKSSGQSSRRSGGPSSDRPRALSITHHTGGGSARRSKRMKPLDISKELIVLMPDDDPVEKLGLDENELPEFICCMEEEYQYDDGEQVPGGAEGSHHSGHADVHVPEGAEVLVPVVSVAGDSPLRGAGQASRDKKKAAASFPSSSSSAAIQQSSEPFTLCGMGESTKGSSYTSYEIESDDEEFIDSLKQESSLDSDDKQKSASSKPKPRISNAKFASLDPRLASALSDDLFSAMLVALEREMMVNLSYIPGRMEIEIARLSCIECLETSEKMIDVVDSSHVALLNDSTSVCVRRLELLVTEGDERADALLTTSSTKFDRTMSTGSFGGSCDDDVSELLKSRHGGSNRGGLTIAVRATTNEAPAGSPRNGAATKPHTESEIVRYSKPQLEAIVPIESALPVLLRVYSSQISGTKDSQAKGDKNSDDAAMAHIDPTPLLTRIYAYWTTKRASRKVSLLRCYHTFIMDNWHVQSDVVPLLPEDHDTAGLIAAHDRLLKLRRDLDRVRLIVDRVRRREKLKRNLVRVAGDALDGYMESLSVIEDEVDQKESKEKAKKSKTGTDESHSNTVAMRQRAAKEAAKERLALPKSGMHAPYGAEPVHDDGEVSVENMVFPFTLEDVDYDALEISAQSLSPNLYGRDDDDGAMYIDPRRGHRANHKRYIPQQSPATGTAATGWTADEDHLLLLGVAACGVGRWTEIREDFLLARNSAQMNQRFTRLARRRCVLVKITGNTTSAAAKRAALKGDDSEEDDGEYTEVRTAFMSQQEISTARSRLPPILAEMLDKYSEDSVWESIALRHLFDTQSKEKRCGRPQKYPLPIPIPKHLQNGGWQSRRKNLVQRPSSLVPGWLAGGGYGAGVQAYQASSSPMPPPTKASQNQQPTHAPPRPRGRPRKYPRRDDEDDDEEDNDSEEEEQDWETIKANQALAAQKKKEEQDQLREERARARSNVLPFADISVETLSKALGISGVSTNKRESASEIAPKIDKKIKLSDTYSTSSGESTSIARLKSSWDEEAAAPTTGKSSAGEKSKLEKKSRTEPTKRGRGRPPKNKGDDESASRKSKRSR